jgi:hypothetical protein
MYHACVRKVFSIQALYQNKFVIICCIMLLNVKSPFYTVGVTLIIAEFYHSLSQHYHEVVVIGFNH